MSTRLLVLLLCTVGMSAFATPTIDPPSRKFSLGLLGGTLGYGAEVGYSPRERSNWQFRLGFTHVGYKKPFDVDVNDDSKLHLSPLVRMNLLQVHADWFPFSRSSFHLTGGLGYQVNPSYAVLGTSDTGLILDDIDIKPEDFGEVQLKLRWWQVTPHLGLGVGRAVPKNRIGVGFELGCYYLGSPKIDFSTTGLLDATTLPDQIPQIEHNMRNYSFLPYLLFSLKYRLTP